MDNNFGNSRLQAPAFTPKQMIDGGYIPDYQYKAYLTKDPKAIETAEKKAMEEAIEKSGEIIPSYPNRARDSSGSQKSPTKKITHSTNSSATPTKPRTNLTPQQKGFELYVKQLKEEEMHIIDQNQMPSFGQEILNFLAAITEKPPKKSEDALNDFRKLIRDCKISTNVPNDNPPSLAALFEDEIREEIDALFTDKKPIPPILKITDIWIKEDGAMDCRSIGKGKEEVFLLRTPENRYQLVFPKKWIDNKKA